jgi:hypothetical protein
MNNVGNKIGRFFLFFCVWLCFGFITSAQLVVVYFITKQQTTNSNKALWLHFAAHVVGLLILLGGGAAVTGGIGGYVPCPNNVTMDRYCMYQQPGRYMFPYILHYIGGGYSCVVSWFLDGCHIVPWSLSGHPLTLFCTPQNSLSSHSILFESRWHLISKGFLTLLVTVTWMLCVDWSTDPSLSEITHATSFVSLNTLLGIFLLEVVGVFSSISVVLWFVRRRAGVADRINDHVVVK